MTDQEKQSKVELYMQGIGMEVHKHILISFADDAENELLAYCDGTDDDYFFLFYALLHSYGDIFRPAMQAALDLYEREQDNSPFERLDNYFECE